MYSGSRWSIDAVDGTGRYAVRRTASNAPVTAVSRPARLSSDRTARSYLQ